MNLYSWFVRGREHADMCRTSIASVMRHDPMAKILVMTDETQRDWRIDNVTVMPIMQDLPIMLANLEAQVIALHYAERLDALRCVFLDTDTIVANPLDASHMVGPVNFTWRDHVLVDEDGQKVEGVATRMPYNYGVIFCRPSLSALETFIWMRERVRSMHPQYQQWYGNQLAAAEFAGAAPESGSDYTTRSIPWSLASHGKTVLVGKLPCEKYNYTPQSIEEDVSGRYILHFKGKKRHLMWQYAERMGLPWTGAKPEPPVEAPSLAVVNIK
jgi:hypothetical protein